MTLDALGNTLPNGFHDAEVSAIRIDYKNREVSLDLLVWVGDMDEREAPTEAYRSATVLIAGLQFISIEPPDPRYPFLKGDSLKIDLESGATSAQIPAIGRLASDCFVSKFFVNEWNSFIHVAARNATLVWKGKMYDRKHSAK